MTNAMANESIFTNFKRELQTLNYAELNYLISDIMLEIKKRSYNEGMVKGMTSYGSAEEVAPVESQKATQKTSQQIRDEIVEKAKRDVAELENKEELAYEYVDYVVNNEKRTIVALIKGVYMEGIVYAKGIAKCDPSDCFNVHIGKAIALRRALGLEVPSEYLNAPQPTEVLVGDVVEHRWTYGDLKSEMSIVIAVEDGDKIRYDDGEFDFIKSLNKNDGGMLVRIADDSREGGDANGEG